MISLHEKRILYKQYVYHEIIFFSFYKIQNYKFVKIYIKFKNKIFFNFCLLIFFLDEVLVNVADISRNAQCSSSTLREDDAHFTFKCENVLQPPWKNMLPFLTICRNNCNRHITIILDKSYSINEFCVSQIFLSLSHKITMATVSFNLIKNMNILLSKTPPIECFTTNNETVLSANKVKFTILGPYDHNKGFGSILLYSYNGSFFNKY